MNERLTEQILSEARSSLEPSQADRERVRKKVIAAIGAAGVVTVASGTAAKATGTVSAGTLIAQSTIVKIGAGVLVIGGVVGMLAYGSGSSSDEAPSKAERAAIPVAQKPTSDEAPPIEPSVDETLADQPAAPPVPVEIAEPELPAPVVEPQKRRARKISEWTTPKPDGPVSKPNDDALLKEISLIKKASRALNQKRPEKTLKILNEYDAAFPKGVMREERDGLKVIALCDLGRRSEAANAKRRFLKRSPSSPMAGRVRDRCQNLENADD